VPTAAPGAATAAKQGPELLAHRLALYEPEQRMVFGATTYRAHAQIESRTLDGHTQELVYRPTLHG
jgi:hypothetical protein